MVINLTKPASDFLNILALPFASAAPVEYLKYVPDGANVSSGELTPGCYDLYVETEYGCGADSTTAEEVAGGLEFTWTVTPSELTCP